MSRRLESERGFTLVELIIVMALLSVVMVGIVNLLISSNRASSNADGRVDSQQDVRLALDRLEYEARCASYATTASGGASVTLSFPSQCTHASGTATWCVSSGSLMRYSGSSCSGTGQTFVKSVTSATPFSILWAANQSPRLQISMTADDTSSTVTSFSDSEAIVLRNASLSLGTQSPTSSAVGASVTITGSGFKPSAALTVTFGSTAATITSGGTTSSSGAVNVTFTVPFSGNGTYNVVVSDGTNSVTSSTKSTVTGSFDGLGWTGTSLSAGSLSCGTPALSNTCTATPLGKSGHFTGKVTLETVAGGAITNSGSAAPVSCTNTLVTTPGGTISPTSSSIAMSASASTSGFTLTGGGVTGWSATMTCSLAVNGQAYSLAVTGS